ncbi:oligosaccharide flippase family protein [Chitinophaga sp.]|uniref:oligosaccharide flippase family protein n=1 Tax=Chitinophaga sp. TaxID=1869181 RepID=UPI0031D6777C
MSTIRKKGIITTIFIYAGFLLGALNTYLYAKYFQPDQTGLTRVLLDIAVLSSSFALLGTNTIVVKFFPYYKNFHKENKSELVTISFIFSLVGFLIIFLSFNTFMKPLIIRKFIGKAPLLVEYFYLVFPLTLFLTLFQVLEAQTWTIQKGHVANFLKEVLFRGINTILNVLFIGGLLSFPLYADLFSFQYFVIFAALIIYLLYARQLKMSFQISKLTKRLWKKMVPYSLFILGSNVISLMSTTMDGIIISSLMGLSFTSVFINTQYISNFIVVPYRAALSMAAGPISQAWKDRDILKLDRIYKKTSLNLLIASSFIFAMIMLNWDDLLNWVKPDPIYHLGKPVMFYLGLYQVIELGTGMNSAIIITSRRWKFELYSNIILLTLTLPLTYILIKHMGMIGAALATLISRTIFNVVRFIFLYKVYNLQPFTKKTLLAVVLPLAVYPLVAYTIHLRDPLMGLIVRSAAFTAVYAFLLLQLRVSEDAMQVFETIKKRVRQLAGR